MYDLDVPPQNSSSEEEWYLDDAAAYNSVSLSPLPFRSYSSPICDYFSRLLPCLNTGLTIFMVNIWLAFVMGTATTRQERVHSVHF